MPSLSARVEALVVQAIPQMRNVVERRTSRPFAAHIVILSSHPAGPDQDDILFDRPVGEDRHKPEHAGRSARYNCFVARRPDHPAHCRQQSPHNNVFWRGCVRQLGTLLVSVSGTEIFDAHCAEILAQAIREEMPEGDAPAHAE